MRAFRRPDVFCRRYPSLLLYCSISDPVQRTANGSIPKNTNESDSTRFPNNSPAYFCVRKKTTKRFSSKKPREKPRTILNRKINILSTFRRSVTRTTSIVILSYDRPRTVFNNRFTSVLHTEPSRIKHFRCGSVYKITTQTTLPTCGHILYYTAVTRLHCYDDN